MYLLLVLVLSLGLTQFKTIGPAGNGGAYTNLERDTMTTPKTTIDDTILNSMLAQTQFGASVQEEEYWFSRGNQKKMVFALGAQLLVSEDMTSAEAIAQAQDYINTFYETTLSPSGWKKD